MGKCAGEATARSAKPKNVGSNPIFPSNLRKHMYKKKITEAQYIRDMKTMGVPEKDFEWHLALYRKIEDLRKNRYLQTY